MRICHLALFFSFSCLAITPSSLCAEIPTDYSQQMKPATLKVLIADKAEGAVLEVKGRYDIFNPETHLPITSGIFNKKAPIYSYGEGIKWDDSFPYINQMRIVPTNADTSILVNGIEYRGCIEIYHLDGVISIVNEVDIENYLKSILAVGISSINDPKVLEALAIIARTNAYYLASRNPQAEWHVKANEANYLGYGVTLQRICLDRAIEKTKNLVMTYKNQPFAATWTENSAGRTSTYASIFRKRVSVPQGVTTPLAARDRQRHHWTVSIPKQEFGRALGLSKLSFITPYLDSQSQKTYAVRVSDGIVTKDIDFFSLQKTLGSHRILSNDFEIQMKGDKVIFTGFGEGHGVGLCLYSAQQMVQQGDSTAKILSYFFPNTQIQNLQKLSSN